MFPRIHAGRARLPVARRKQRRNRLHTRRSRVGAAGRERAAGGRIGQIRHRSGDRFGGPLGIVGGHGIQQGAGVGFLA